MPIAARLFIAVIGLAGLAGMAVTFRGWTPEPEPRFVVYLVLALLSSGMKVRFPGVHGTISVNFVFIMLGLLELTPPETLFLAVASAAAQTFWHAKGKSQAGTALLQHHLHRVGGAGRQLGLSTALAYQCAAKANCCGLRWRESPISSRTTFPWRL